MPTGTDGTVLNFGVGGDQIDDEIITGGTQSSSTAGKIPRSKIALGSRNHDDGDISTSNPMPVAGTKGSKHFTLVTLSGTAAQVLAARTGRIRAFMQNSGSATATFGVDNTVTTSTGLAVLAGQTLDDPDSNDAWWGITAGGSVTIVVCEVY
jgi:hypothetical protein